jgi:hypothetical protein
MTKPISRDYPAQSRWGPIVLVFVLLGILTLLPHRMRVFPGWVAYVSALVLFIPLLGTQLSHGAAPWQRVERFTVFAFSIFNGIAVVLLLWRLVTAIVYHTPHVEPIPLLASGAAIWIVNTCIFALLYWELDAGGTSEHSGQRLNSDFLFVQADDDANPPTGRVKSFTDYLFLAFTTSTAFSPTDTSPITARAKILMMIQSFIALVTLTTVAARAINVLR